MREANTTDLSLLFLLAIIWVGVAELFYQVTVTLSLDSYPMQSAMIKKITTIQIGEMKMHLRNKKTFVQKSVFFYLERHNLFLVYTLPLHLKS